MRICVHIYIVFCYMPYAKVWRESDEEISLNSEWRWFAHSSWKCNHFILIGDQVIQSLHI